MIFCTAPVYFSEFTSPFFIIIFHTGKLKVTDICMHKGKLNVRDHGGGRKKDGE